MVLVSSACPSAPCEETFRSLLPEISQVFSEWDDRALKQFHRHLEKLTCWLDTNRIG